MPSSIASLTPSHFISSLTVLIISCLFFTPTARAADLSLRYESFFPKSKRDFAFLSENTCNATLAHYRSLFANATSILAVDLGLNSQQTIINACRAHENCILGNASEEIKANLSTASVVLGLLPTLLAVLSPSVAEIALLSAQRPLLAMIASVGSPGLLQTRIFEYLDPGELLDVPEHVQAEGKSVRLQLVFGPWRRGWFSATVSLVEYLLVIAAVVNTQWLAVEVSQKSILSWGCTRAIWPTVLWSGMPLIIDGIGSLGYRLTLDRSGARKKAEEEPSPEGIMMTAPNRSHSFFAQPNHNKTATATTVSSTSSSPIINAQKRGSRWHVFSEFIPCACHPPALRARLSHRELPSARVRLGIALQCFSGFLSFFHLLYGTVTFSGLLFIDTLDAFAIVMMRLLASSLICRFVVLVELAGMRGALLSSRSKERDE